MTPDSRADIFSKFAGVKRAKDAPLPPHEPDYGRTGHPKYWCARCRIEATLGVPAYTPTTPDPARLTLGEP